MTIHRSPRNVQIPRDYHAEPAALEAETLIAQARMDSQLMIVSCPDDFARLGRAVGRCGAVDGVDVHKRQGLVGAALDVGGIANDLGVSTDDVRLSRPELHDRDAPFEIPACVPDIRYVLAGKVLSEESAHAVEPAAETASVVFIPGEVDVEGVSVLWCRSVLLAEGRVDRAEKSQWRLLVNGTDLQLLEQHNLWPAMSLQESSKRITLETRLEFCAFLKQRCSFAALLWTDRLEIRSNGGVGCREEGLDAVNVP